MSPVLSVLIHTGVKFTMGLIFLLKLWITWTIIRCAAINVIYLMLWSPKIVVRSPVADFIID
uniref:Uncharacterized protein n=1 Tax=Arundo donax TaxID=35708 RepID=A0A0A9GQE5_ARUDO